MKTQDKEITSEELAQQYILDFTASTKWSEIALLDWTTADMMEHMEEFANSLLSQQKANEKELLSEAYSAGVNDGIDSAGLISGNTVEEAMSPIDFETWYNQLKNQKDL